MSFKTTRNMAVGIRQRMAGIFGGISATYIDKVLGYGPIAYWPLYETAGATAVCLVNSPAQDGAYVGVTLGQEGIGDGNTAPYFDGANDYVNIYTVAFRDAFDGDVGSAMIWLRLVNAGEWTSGTRREALSLRNDNSNYVLLERPTTNNELRGERIGSGFSDGVSNNSQGGSTAWIHMAMTWDTVADELKLYLNGAQVGPTQGTLGAWAGVLHATRTLIGAFFITGRVWFGWLAHAAVWDAVLTQPQLLDLATV